MPSMATVNQQEFIRELLDALDADLADFTGKELHELTVAEASVIIADLKSEQFIRRCRRR